MESDCAGTEICSSLRVSSAFAPPRSLESATAFCIGVPFSEICSSQARSELLKATTTRSSSDSRRKNIRVLIRSEMPELASAKRGMFAPNPQQFLDIRENLLLFAGSPGLRETVIRVFGPSSGENPAGCPGRRLPAFQSHRRNRSPECRAESASARSQLQFRRGTPFGTRKAWHVVICKKRHQPIRAWIQRIVPQHVRDAAHGGASQQHIAQGKKHGKVKYRRQSAINPVVAAHSTHKK